MNFKYCPNCGEQDAVVAQSSTDYICTACSWHYWNNPRGAAGGLFIRDGHFLSAKRGIDPDFGKYELPGGFVEYGEDAYKACARELKEETGINVETTDLELITAYTCEYMAGVSSLDLLFVVKKWSGEPVANDDVAELEWKPLSFLSDPSFIRAYPDLQKKLEDYLKK